jgi:hypothetical protein
MARADLKYVIGFEANDASVVQATKALKKLTDQQSFLDREFKKGRISQGVFRKGQKQLNDEITKLRSATKQGGNALKQYITQMDASGKATRRKEIAMQQAGYQLQDFIVQIQAGTNPLIAFSQQGSQLAGFFAGPWGAAIGLGIAAIGGLGTALMNAGIFADSTDRKFKTLKDTIDSLKSASMSAAEEAAFIFSGFGTVEEFRASEALKDAVLELSQRTGGKINAQNFRDIDVSSYVGAADFAGEFSGSLRAFETLFGTGTVGLVTNAQKAANELDTALAIANGLAKARRKQAAEEAELAAISEAAMEAVIHGPKKAAEEAARAAEQQAQERKKLLETYNVDIAKRSSLIGLEGEQLLLTKQRLEKESLLANLASKGLDIGDYETQQLVQKLGYLQAEELRQFRIEAAEKKRIENQKNLNKALAKQKKIQAQLERNAAAYGQAMEKGLMSIVDGTKTVEQAFRDMARDIIAHLYRVLVVQQMVRGFGGALGGSSNPFLSAIGQGLSTYGSAEGGAYTGNGPRSGGLDGKGGFMMMVHPRETIVDHTRGQGVGGEVINVTQNINVSTGVQQTVRAEIKQLMPQIANSAKSAVLDAKRRGGAYGRGFA